MADPALIDAFNDCIDRLNAGESLAACLDRYPALADQLRPLLESGLGVQRARAGAAEVQAARSRAQLRFERALARPAARQIWQRPLALAASLVLVLLVVAGGGYAVSQLITMSTPTPTVVPTVTVMPTVAVTPTPSPTPTLTVTQTGTPTLTPSPTATPTLSPTASLTPLVTPSVTRTPATLPTNTPPQAASPATCQPNPPSGWVDYRIQNGDTLSDLAATTGTTPDELIAANCLANTTIVVGETLFLPYAPQSQSPANPTVAPPPSASGGNDGGGDDSGSGSDDSDDDDHSGSGSDNSGSGSSNSGPGSDNSGSGSDDDSHDNDDDDHSDDD